MRLPVPILATAVLLAAAVAPAAASGQVEPFRPLGIVAADAPAEAAQAAIAQRPGLFDAAAEAELVVTGEGKALGGITVVRLEQRIDGVPVLGGEAVVALDRRNRVVAASGEAVDGPGPDTQARITAASARSIALRELGREHGGGLTATEPELVVFDPTLFGGPGLPGGTLVWDLVVERFPDIGRRVLVDADTGAIVLDIDDNHAAKERHVCDAAESSATTTALRNRDAPATYCGTGTAIRSEGGPSAALAEANAVYDDLGTTYDYFAALDRDSIDDEGMPLRAIVRACPAGSACPYRNAFWSSSNQAMVFGTDFGLALDVTAHELVHGITDAESELFYWYQSGAINESLSDVFGELVELSSADPGSAAHRWLLGEDLPIGAIRDMENPGAFGDPASMTDALYHLSTDDNGGVHVNSGVGNRAASLMADGGALNGQVVTGIGLAKTGRIWYQASRLLRSGSSYADLAVALVDGCQSIVGIAGIASDDCTHVANAVTATRMTLPPPVGASTPQAPVCASGTLALVYATSFEDGLTGWSAGPGWFDTLEDSDWWRLAASGRHNAWAWDYPSEALDTRLAMTNGLVVPAGAYLRFSHAFGLDAGEGAVVEYTTDEGATWIDVSTLAVDDGYGYNGTVAAGSGALAGRSAFVGSSNGLRATRVSLAALAGQTARFRFRFANVAGNQNEGWFVDDVIVYTCPDSAPTTETAVTVTRSGGPGNGTVLMTPSGQTPGTGDALCRFGSTGCSVPSSAGAFVTLRAVPDPLSAFAGWAGACTGTRPVCTVTASEARSATATFAYTGPTPPAVASFATLGRSEMVADAFWMRLQFDEDVTGFQTSDVFTVTTGAASCSVERHAQISPSTYDIRLSSCSGFGTIRLRLHPDSVADAEGTLGPSAAASSDAVSFVMPTPPVVASFGPAGPSTTTSPNPVVAIAFDEDVSGLDANDLELRSTLGLICRVDAVVPTGTRTYAIELACAGVGTVQIDLRADAVVDGIGSTGPATSATSLPVTIELPPAPPTPPVDTPTPPVDTPTPPADAPATQNPPVLRGTAVTWAPPNARGVVASSFAAAPGTTYRIAATRLGGRASKTLRRTGACRVAKSRATCSVRLAKGRWRVEITPVAQGVAGAPVRRTVSIR